MKTKRSSRSLLTPRRAYFGLLIILTFDLLNLYWASLTPAPARNYAQAVWPRSLVNKYDFGQRWVALGFFGDANVHLFSNIDAANGYDAMIGQNFTDYSLLVTSYLSRPYNDWFVPRRYNSLMKIAAVTHDVWRADARDDEAIAIHTHLQTAQKFGEWYLAEYKSTWPRFYVSRNIVETPREQQLAVLKNLTLGDFAQQHRPVVAEPRAFAVIDSPLQPQDRVLDASRTINTLTLSVSATQPSVLVAAESNFAGWKAWVNGKPTPIHDANYLFRGIEVPRGTSRVQMAYEPQTYRFGLFLSLCGLLISSAWLASWLASRNTKRTSATII